MCVLVMRSIHNQQSTAGTRLNRNYTEDEHKPNERTHWIYATTIKPRTQRMLSFDLCLHSHHQQCLRVQTR
jgi:hypothetical protein